MSHLALEWVQPAKLSPKCRALKLNTRNAEEGDLNAFLAVSPKPETRNPKPQALSFKTQALSFLNSPHPKPQARKTLNPKP